MSRMCSLVTAVATLSAAAIVAGCSIQGQARGNSPTAFGSIDEAYNAVDEVLKCESDPVGGPIVPMDGAVHLALEQRLCSENIQIDLYPDHDALQRSYQIWADSHQGKVHLVRGENWLVVDVTEVATGAPTSWNIESLTEKLTSEYSVVGA
jgi:hypothetical protein